MKYSNNNAKVFLALIRAGLWEEQTCLLPYGIIDFNEVHRLSEEQSILGVVAAGIEHVTDVKTPREVALEFAGYTLQMEQQNTAMNYFIGLLMNKIYAANVNVILIKGQGVAQCYERPLWRANGDVDLLLDEDNYHSAKEFLSGISKVLEEEDVDSLHYAVAIDPWIVELHGTFRTGLGKRIDSVIDAVQNETFEKNLIRNWQNGETKVQLPAPDNDVFFVFTHILQHFFRGGIGLRQICDWCRLLWTYRDSLDIRLLETRLNKAGLMSEWKAFAALAVDTLGMPVDAMPLYDNSTKWTKKGERILSLVLETGNFGHNRDTSYQQNYPFLINKLISFYRSTCDSLKRGLIFPKDSLRVWWIQLIKGIKAAIIRK